MQKDFHFYLTYALGRKAGLSPEDAELIAWADEYTDEVTKPDLHGIQTQAEVIGNWDVRQIQLSVLVPFHFVPGDDPDHPWKTTRNSPNARGLVQSAMGDLLRLGISLHAFQDTFSHENFSGWREKLNKCFEWYHLETALESILPNIGHAEMRVIPDVIHYSWTDPRTGEQVNNQERALAAAEATYQFLLQLSGAPGTPWSDLDPPLRSAFALKSYDDRVTALCQLSGNTGLDYKNSNQTLASPNEVAFTRAACEHLAEAVGLFKGLPWLS